MGGQGGRPPGAPVRVFLWTDQDEPRSLEGMPRYLLARSGGKSIFTNRKLLNQ